MDLVQFSASKRRRIISNPNVTETTQSCRHTTVILAIKCHNFANFPSHLLFVVYGKLPIKTPKKLNLTVRISSNILTFKAYFLKFVSNQNPIIFFIGFLYLSELSKIKQLSKYFGKSIWHYFGLKHLCDIYSRALLCGQMSVYKQVSFKIMKSCLGRPIESEIVSMTNGHNFIAALQSPIIQNIYKSKVWVSALIYVFFSDWTQLMAVFSDHFCF